MERILYTQLQMAIISYELIVPTIVI